MSSKRQQVNIETKYRALREVENGVKKCIVAEKFGIPQNTLSTWVKNRHKITHAYESGECSSKAKKIRIADNPDIDKAINTWITDARAQNIPISGELVRQQANRFANRFGKHGFKASRGWLARYKSRKNLSFRKIRGESRSVTPEMTEKWFVHDLPQLLSSYSPDDVYNMDETSLFFKAPADKSLILPGENASGIKVSKERVTIALCVNMTGTDKQQPVIIGRSRRPRCLRKIEKMPVAYYSNKRAWMSSEIFEDWCGKWNRRLVMQKRNIVLVLDNCPSHPHLDLSNITLVFLPPGTTSKTQPLDQGIIANLKVKYRTRITNDQLDALDNKIPWTWTLENAIYALMGAWRDVKVDTVKNCFRHCHFVLPSVVHNDEEDEEDDLPLAQLADRLKAAGSVLTEEQVGDYLLSDDNEPCHAPITEDEIVSHVSRQEEEKDAEDENDSDDDDLPVGNFSLGEAILACNTIKQHIIRSPVYSEDDDKALVLLGELNALLVRRSSRVMRQQTLDAFISRHPSS